MVRVPYQFLSTCADCPPSADGFEHAPQEASSVGLDATQGTDSAHDTNDGDGADIRDAEVLELLANYTSTNTVRDHPVEAQSAAPPIDPLPPAHPPNAESSNTVAPLAIGHFPHGSPGVPVPGVHRGSPGYQ